MAKKNNKDGYKESEDRVSKKSKKFVAKADHAIQELEKKYLNNRSEWGKCQLEEIQKLKNKYYDQQVDNRLGERIFAGVADELYQSYLSCIKENYSPYFDENELEWIDSHISSFDVTRWVIDSEEKAIDKLISVYEVLSGEDCCIALIYNRTKEGCKVTFSVRNIDIENTTQEKVLELKNKLKKAFEGNFPGIIINDDNTAEIPATFSPLMDISFAEKERINSESGEREKYIETSNVPSVAVVTNMPSDKSEDFISQSMEKLIDGIVPKDVNENYCLVLLASPIKDVSPRKNRLFEIYNLLSPYATWQGSITTNESETIGVGASLGKHIGIEVGMHSDFNVQATAGFEGSSISAGNTTGFNVGANAGLSVDKNEHKDYNAGLAKGDIRTYTNYSIKYALDFIEKQIKRIDECAALGMWEFSAYSVSKDPVTAKAVASMYQSLTQGENSYLSNNAINMWTSKDPGIIEIVNNIRILRHPDFILKAKDETAMSYPGIVRLSTLISGKEMVRALNFPRKSIVGLTVVESAPFGREVVKYSVSRDDKQNNVKEKNKDTIAIGKIVHMYRAENTDVELDTNSLSSHTFITGATGAGKSNSIYQIIEKLIEKNKKILVIEPAKGEYYKEFPKFRLYGTNPTLCDEVLGINPFAFPSYVHVLEHIDRLIEILNSCWPMYAAMPAVLKDAIERSYTEKGWNLLTNECVNEIQYPTFKDVLRVLPEVMDESMYSDDTKSDYSGALITRIRSLTNGINGYIFNPNRDDIGKVLSQNAVIDLSRVGSMETKALIMGMLIMKMQEHYMDPKRKSNKDLAHVTVLEEAHNILRKTSIAQSQDSSNLQGKAVEMITNSIAEMRTYGEGFIIADQAPGLLDEAVIRNTNTKIILRLPDFDDRTLVGKAASLEENQIEELAKLPTGVAAIYQNDWVEAVLCQFEEHKADSSNREIKPEGIKKEKAPNTGFFIRLFNISDKAISEEDVDGIEGWIDSAVFPSDTKNMLRSVLRGEVLAEEDQAMLAYNIFDGKNIAKQLRDSVNVDACKNKVNERIKSMYLIEDNEELINRIRLLILRHIENNVPADYFNKYLASYKPDRRR